MTDNNNIMELVSAIARLPGDWHGQGTMGRGVLEAIIKHAQFEGGVKNSVETGSGKTTLLLSQLSESHLVFAIDLDESISKVRESEYFNNSSTSYIEGPTQRTLPNHRFTELNQVILIDGPHGYPFPDLEYYYLYPTLAPGGLLIIDDIRIPSISRMLEIIKMDDMFTLIEVVDENTAFLRRTDAPTFNPEGDDWWTQGYNLKHYKKITAVHPSIKAPTTSFGRVLKWASQNTPRPIKRLLPGNIKERIWQSSSH